MVQDSAVEVREQQANNLVEALCSEQKTEEQRKALMDSIQQARKENPTILTTITTKLAAMEKGPQRAIANDNLRSLQERIAANNASPEAQADVVALRTEIDVVQKELDALDKPKEATQPAMPVAEVAKSGVTPDSQKQIQQNPEKWLPQSMNPREWTDKQIATVSAITIGAVGLFALWKYMRSDSNASASGAKKNKWHSLLWVPVLGLAGYLGYSAWKKYGGVREAASAGVDAVKKKVDEIQSEIAPWKDYGLEKTQYEEAENLYRAKREQGVPEIAAIFGVSPETKEGPYVKFLDEMRSKYEIQDEEGIHYARADVVVMNYEQNLEVGLSKLAQWVQNHALETGVVTLIAYKLGILRAILQSGLSTGKKALEVANAMRKWGIGHPIISLFLLGGSVLGASSALQAARKTYLPENLSELVKAGLRNKPLLKGEDNGVGSHFSDAGEHITDIGEEIENFGTWATTKTADLVVQLDANMASEWNLTPEELAINRNYDCLEALRGYLEEGKKNSETSTRDIHSGRVEAYALALKCLETYHIALIAERCVDFSLSDTPKIALQELRAALTAVEVQTEVTDGAVTWKDEGMPEAWDLSADPAIADKSEFEKCSHELQHGESDPTYIFFRGVDRLRQLSQEGTDKLEGIPTGSKAVAMVLGNFLYFVEIDPSTGFIDWGNVENYCMVPVDIATQLLDKDTSWKEWGATVSMGTATTALFSLNAALLAKVKQFVIGGGPLMKSMKARAVLSVIPGVAHARLGLNVYRGIQDFAMIKKFGFWNGRLVNTVCAKAGIRPEWIRAIETGDQKTLEFLAKTRIKIKSTSWANPEELRTALRNQVIERFKPVTIHDLGDLKTLRPWNVFFETEIPAEQFYKNLADVWKGGEVPEDLLAASINEVDEVLTKPLGTNLPDGPAKPNGAADELVNAAKAEDAVETLSEADQAKLKALLGKFGDVEDVKNVRAFLEAAAEQKLLKLDTDVLALIDQSPGAQKIIAGAVKSSEVMEVTRAMRAARVARNWRVGFNAVGAVGDVFGLYMAVADFRENGRNLEQARNTNNAALMEVYKGARVMNLVEGAEASASLGYGVTVIGWSWYTGQGFCTAVSASGALIMLPIAAVVLTAGATRRMTTNASEISMRTAEDWVAALSPGELLEKLEEISPGSQGTYSQRQTMGSFAEQSFRWLGSRHSTKAREGFRDWNEDNARVIEGNNASARQEITKAYITHTSGDFLSPDAGEDQESYNKRFHQFVEDQMKYVEKSTAGSFMRLRGGYDRARTYATLLAKSRALQAEGKHEFLQWTDEGTGQKHQFDIAEFQNASWKDTGEAPSQFILLSHFIDVEKTMEVAGVVLTKKMSESAATAKVAVKQQLILAIADDIHWLDGRVQSANGSAAMKHGIASWLAGELERETSVLMDKDSIGFEDYAKARLRLGGFCHQKDLLQRVTDDQRRKINKPGRHSAEPASEILTPMGMMRRVTVAAERKQAA